MHSFRWQSQLGETLNAPKRNRRYLNRDRESTNERFVHDYYVDDCLYDNDAFKLRYHLSRNLFIRVANDLKDNYKIFQLI